MKIKIITKEGYFIWFQNKNEKTKRIKFKMRKAIRSFLSNQITINVNELCIY